MANIIKYCIFHADWMDKARETRHYYYLYIKFSLTRNIFVIVYINARPLHGTKPNCCTSFSKLYTQIEYHFIRFLLQIFIAKVKELSLVLKEDTIQF